MTFVSTTSSSALYGDSNRIIAAADPLPPFPKGAYSKVNVDRQDVQMMATFATKTILKKHKNLQESHYTLSSVESAEVQVVSGFNYKMCLKLKGKNQDDQLCNVVVYDEPWTKTLEVTSYHCCYQNFDRSQPESKDRGVSQGRESCIHDESCPVVSDEEQKESRILYQVSHIPSMEGISSFNGALRRSDKEMLEEPGFIWAF